MTEDLLDHHRIFYAGDNLNGAAAHRAGLDIDVENPLQALHPGHRGPALGGCFFFPVPIRMTFVSLPPLCRHDQRPVLAVRCKHPMETGEIDSRFRHQRRQSCDKIQWLKDDVGRSAPKGVLSW